MTRLYEANDHILIHTESFRPGQHRHKAVCVVISLGGSLRVRSGGREFLCHGILLPSGADHGVDTGGNAVLVFLYDCTTGVAKQIREVSCIPKDCCGEILRAYGDLGEVRTPEGYCRFEETVLNRLGITGQSRTIQDERILSAMGYIRANATEKITCRDAARAAHLSQGRFSHLFREQVGMTFAAYLIYQRILHVYARVIRGGSITEAALEAGFSSSAHFADVNRRLFGLPASSILQDLAFIKVY